MWDCTIQKINHIKPIDGADSIELAIIGYNWPVVVRKNTFCVGESVAYFMADSILPDALIESLGLTGKLAGSAKNRIKPVKLRGQLSIGIITKCPFGFKDGDSVTEYFGITRYEEPIPVELSGKIVGRPKSYIKYDIDSYRSFNEMIDGEDCVVTEKVHESNCGIYFEDKLYVCSRSYALEESENNTYWKCVRSANLQESLPKYCADNSYNSIVIYGGTVGVQDLKYGTREPFLIVFDAKINGIWCDYDDFLRIVKDLNLRAVPEIYRGPYHNEIINSYTSGKELVSGKMLHIREGIVIKPVKNRYNYRGNRVVMKSVSEEYLMRKNGSELH